MENILGQNIERDNIAKRKIFGEYYLESVGLTVLCGIASFLGMNPGASMRMKYSAKQNLKRKRDQKWSYYCKTGKY